MLSKEERKERNTLFWNEFRKEMRQETSCNGKHIDWVAYPLRIKDIYLRMETDGKGAKFCIDIQPKDDGIRELIWEQMIELRKVLEEDMGVANWIERDRVVSGRNVSRIEWSKNGINFYQDDNLPEFKSFFKKKLIDFDYFYQEYKDVLLALVS